jgi:hypothetical protein
MSTPITTLPLKTQQTNIDNNDINDPIVQDVLNEFQEELMNSKQPNKSQQMTSQQMQQQQQNMLQMQQQMLLQQPPMINQPPNYNSRNYINKYDNISAYADVDIAKRSLILVILSLIIYHSGIINNVYEKLPDYLQDNLNNFDIYIKSASFFSVIYILSFFDYI